MKSQPHAARLPKMGSFLLLITILLSGCTTMADDLPVADASSPTATTMSKPVPQQTTAATATSAAGAAPASAATATASPSPSPSIPPALTTAAMPTSLGRIYQYYSGGAYAWQALMASDGEITAAQEMVIYSPDDPVGPANSSLFAYSRYSGQIAYWTRTFPSELWVADAALTQPRRIFVDELGAYVDETFLPRARLELAWSLDDSLLLVYAFDSAAAHLIYDLSSGQVESWFWRCQDLIISPRTSQFAQLCQPDVEQTATYAVLERGGEIWYTDTAPDEIVSAALADGVIPWRVSADGAMAAYYAPDDPEARLLLLDTGRNLRRLLPGSSLLQQDASISHFAVQYYEIFARRDLGFFRWSPDGQRLLAYALGGANHACRPLRDSETDQFHDVPCWQVIDVASGQVIWTDAASAASLFPNTNDLERMAIIQAEFSPDGAMIVVRGQYFSDGLVAIVDLQTFAAVPLRPALPYPELSWSEMP